MPALPGTETETLLEETKKGAKSEMEVDEEPASTKSDDDVDDVDDVEDDDGNTAGVGEEKDLSHDGGVLKTILKKGSGWKKPAKGAEVEVHYVGKLHGTDTVFDSSRDRSEPFKFHVGKQEVIKGWDIGIQSMLKGEVAKFVLKPEYAYGEAGSPPKIPANSTLDFEVELLNWTEEEDINHDGGLLKKVLQEGKDWKKPKDDEKVTVSLRLYVGVEEEKVEVHHAANATFNVGCDESLCSGIDEIVKNMKKHEKCVVKISPKYGFGSNGGLDGKVPRDAWLTAEVELLDWEAAKETWELSGKEKLDYCVQLKNEGNELFKDGKLERALRKYKKAHECVQYDHSFKDEEEKKESGNLKNTCLLNQCAVNLKKKDYKAVLEDSKKVLEKDPKNLKGLFRSGQAHEGLDNWDAAEQCYKAMLELDAKCADAVKALRGLKQKKIDQNKKDKAIFQQMFKNFHYSDGIEVTHSKKDDDMMDDMDEAGDEEMPPLEPNPVEEEGSKDKKVEEMEEDK